METVVITKFLKTLFEEELGDLVLKSLPKEIQDNPNLRINFRSDSSQGTVCEAFCEDIRIVQDDIKDLLKTILAAQMNKVHLSPETLDRIKAALSEEPS